MWRMLVVMLLASFFVPFAAAPTPSLAADCRFVLGFKALHDLIPAAVGDCLANEHYNPQNGDALQEATAWHGKGGLLVWRKADNWTAFTDGAATWINGPYGVQKRLNTECFQWENCGGSRPATGTLLRDSQRNGLGRYVVKNERAVDALAVLSAGTDPGAVLFAVYVRARETAAVERIPNGTYYLYYTTGENWSPDRGRFTRNANYRRSDASDVFTTTPTAEGVRYRVVTATLLEGGGGNAASSWVDPARFPGVR